MVVCCCKGACCVFRTQAVLKSQDTTWSTAAGDSPESLTGSFLLIEVSASVLSETCCFCLTVFKFTCSHVTPYVVMTDGGQGVWFMRFYSSKFRIRLVYVTRVWMQWSRQDDTHKAASSALTLLVLPNCEQHSLQSSSKTSVSMTAPKERKHYHFMTLKMQRTGSSVSQHSGLARASKSLHIFWRVKREKLKGSTHAEVMLRTYKC